MFKTFRKGLVYSVSGISFLYCTSRFVCAVGKCEDVSMEPAIQHGDIVLITPFHVSQNRVVKGDIVFCHSPKNTRSVICKRVIGMEGDTVTDIDTGHKAMVNQGHVWLEGDNKEASIDSRNFGPVPYGLLISKVSFRIWPLRRIGFLALQGERS